MFVISVINPLSNKVFHVTATVNIDKYLEDLIYKSFNWNAKTEAFRKRCEEVKMIVGEGYLPVIKVECVYSDKKYSNSLYLLFDDLIRPSFSMEY